MKRFNYFPNHGDEKGRGCWTVCYGEVSDIDHKIICCTDKEKDAKYACEMLNGIIDNDGVKCEWCDGMGWIINEDHKDYPNYQQKIDCHHCKATGRIGKKIYTVEFPPYMHPSHISLDSIKTLCGRDIDVSGCELHEVLETEAKDECDCELCKKTKLYAELP